MRRFQYSNIQFLKVSQSNTSLNILRYRYNCSTFLYRLILYLSKQGMRANKESNLIKLKSIYLFKKSGNKKN